MKTIVKTDSDTSLYLFDDEKEVNMQTNQINVGDPSNLDFIIGDLNSQNAVLYENVTNAPDDWFGGKYTFDGATWTAVPGWVNPLSE
jgi:hypothetical protein